MAAPSTVPLVYNWRSLLVPTTVCTFLSLPPNFWRRHRWTANTMRRPPPPHVRGADALPDGVLHGHVDKPLGGRGDQHSCRSRGRSHLGCWTLWSRDRTRPTAPWPGHRTWVATRPVHSSPTPSSRTWSLRRECVTRGRDKQRTSIIRWRCQVPPLVVFFDCRFASYNMTLFN